MRGNYSGRPDTFLPENVAATMDEILVTDPRRIFAPDPESRPALRGR